jgi:hypothetical protein
MRYFKSVPEAIDALGGDTKFAKLYGVSRQCVRHWRKRGFPAERHDAMSKWLRAEHQIELPPEAWGQIAA